MDFTREALLAELELKDDIIDQLRKELEEYRMMNSVRKTAISSEPDVQVKRPIIGKSDEWVELIEMYCTKRTLGLVRITQNT